MDKFNEFLRCSKCSITKTSALSNSEIHFIIGNETADLDSIISSLIYAFYLHTRNSNASSISVVIPVIWTEQKDLVLRNETVKLFQKYNLDVNNLVFKDEIDFDVYINKSFKTQVTLVDHNNTNCHPYLTEYVTNIFDHHKDCNEHNSAKKNIQMLGSCCTLIAEEIYYNYKDLFLLEPVADFLLAAILVDTINLNLHAGRTTEVDIFFAGVLLDYSDIDSDQFFKELETAKMDISTMDTFDILRKDFKQVPCSKNISIKIGFSSATIQPLSLIQRDDFVVVKDAFVNVQKVNIFVIMFLSYSHDKVIERHLAVYAENIELRKQVIAYLHSNKDKINLDESNNILDYLFQHGAKYSRKVVLPLLKELDF